MKFLVPNYSCLQNPWLRGYRPQIHVLSVLCPPLNLLNPPRPRKKFLGTPLVLSILLFFALFVLCFFVCVCFSVSSFPSLQLCHPKHCGGLLWPCSPSKMHSHTVRLLWTRDRPVAEASTCTGHKNRSRQTSMPPAGLEPRSQQYSGSRPTH